MTRKKQQAFGAIGICINNKKEILLTQRHEPQRPQIHLKWQLPGGGIEFGETTQQTVKRELLEEIGCKIKIIKLIPYITTHIYHYPKTDIQVTLISYLVKIISNKPHSTHYETAAVKWIKPDKINFADCLPKTEEIIRATKLI